jgi:hypothetical protein
MPQWAWQVLTPGPLTPQATVTIPGDIIGLATIDIDNRATGNSADINLYSADDIVLQARDRTLGSTSEGGDINIYAGDSAEDGDSSGGDVNIRAGDGGAGNVDYGGAGGLLLYSLAEVVQPLATLMPLPSLAVHSHSVLVMLATTTATLILVLMAVTYSLNLDSPQATPIMVATLC